MEIRMHGVYMVGKHKALIDLFGYCGKGLPGIEIKGPKKGLEQVKEKFIYLSRNRNLKIPLKKITLCVESKAFDDTPKGAHYALLELPLLLLFWNLCEFISIHNLQNCLSGGLISINGLIQSISIQNQEYQELSKKDLVLILSEKQQPQNTQEFEIPILPLEAILKDIPNLEFTQS